MNDLRWQIIDALVKKGWPRLKAQDYVHDNLCKSTGPTVHDYELDPEKVADMTMGHCLDCGTCPPECEEETDA